MSAICGIFNKDESTISPETCHKMIEKLKVYPLDYISKWGKKGVFLGCGMQRITPESLNEKLPLFDKDKGLIITADAIIDNRGELLAAFNISKELKKAITDSALILLAYDKWGKECPRYLVGDFAFAIWDEKKKELFCVRDHTGTRTFYYYHSENIFAFCTIIKPLFVMFHTKISLNEKWITDFLALPLILHQCECGETIYENIYELPPATSMTINARRIIREIYWNPLNDIKLLQLKDDKAYEEQFRKVFFEAVKCRLRSAGEVGIMLSGGMDSGSVACVAAKQLAKQDERLKAYSSIPMRGYVSEFNKYVITDESEYIEEIKHENGNIDLKYCRSEGKNPIKDVQYSLKIFEQPHKIIENMFWRNEILNIAAQENCKVILNGQSGNYTVSYGDFITEMVTLFGNKKILNMINEIDAFSKSHKMSRKKLIKAVVTAIIPYDLKRVINVNIRKNARVFDSNLVDKKLAEKWNVRDRYLKKGYFSEVQRFYNTNEAKRFVVDPVMFSHIASIECKASLAYGMVERDPTRDKRLIEFCLSLPSNQFVSNGQDRYLIRRALKGILPDKIRLNIFTRGYQSADWVQRLEENWEDTYEKLHRLTKDNNAVHYVDTEELIKNINELGETAAKSSKPALRKLIVVYIFSEFLKNHFNNYCLENA